MSNTYKRKSIIKALTCFMTISFTFCLDAMSVNGKPLSTWVNPGEGLTVTPTYQREGNFIQITMRENNLKIKCDNINNLNNLTETFESLINGEELCLWQEKSISECAYSISYKNIQLASEKVLLKSKNPLEVESLLIKSPQVEVKSNVMKFTHCFFINPNQLILKTPSVYSNYRSLRITFNKITTKPTIITGYINFTNNETIKPLILTNVEKIEIEFSEDIMKKLGSKK